MGGTNSKWNDQSKWNLYDYDTEEGIYAVYEETEYNWIVAFVEKTDGGYVETYDNVDWSWTPSSNQEAIESISSYDFEWGGSHEKWNQNSEWLVYEVSSELFVVYESETQGWLQGFVEKDGSTWKEASQISYEGGTNGTIRDDIIVSPDREQKDQIFGKEGDDVINAGRAIDRIKGGAGDDVIWGGTNVSSQSNGSAHSMGESVDGDVAYYSSAQNQYTVIRNVFVHAESEGGDVDRDDRGRVKIYGEGAIPAKGVFVMTPQLKR